MPTAFLDEVWALRRLNLFAKGNVDVRDSLLYMRVGGEVVWNGINEVVRRRFPGNVVRVRHETWNRSDALIAAGDTPEGLKARNLPLGPYGVESQFSRAVVSTKADVVVLSVQPDVMNTLVRHKREGYLFTPAGKEQWPAEDKRWLRDEFEPVDRLSPEESAENMKLVCRAIQGGNDCPILIYNMSSVVPGDRVHCHAGLGETLSARIRGFDLGLIEVSRELGVSVVDVDAVVARHGAEALKVDPVHLTALGNRLVAEEVVRILDDLGCFEGPG